MGDEVKVELKYSQEDMDNITAKVKESTISKFEKTHISKDTYNELKSKYEELISSNLKEGFKSRFLSQGGSEGAFEDFYKLECENIAKLGEGDYDKYFDDVSKQKSWAFTNSNKTEGERDQEIMKGLMSDNIDLIEGTIYYKNPNQYRKK